jgi:capsular exopolysaccharide synthesis family protein
LVLAVGGALVVDYSRGTLNYPEEIFNAIDAPLLGMIVDAREKDPKLGPFVLRYPRSPITESVRSLVINLDFQKTKLPWKTILISAAGEGEGVSFTSVNIASMFALSGRKVILIDANGMKGIDQFYFSHQNEAGLEELLQNPAKLSKCSFISELLPTLTVIPPGTVSGSQTTFSEAKVTELFTRLTKLADIIIIDSSPVSRADARIMASKADAVLLLLRPHHTRATELANGLKQLALTRTPVIGKVISKVSKSELSDFT